ncbi:hypothetical protein O4H66_02700 [Comamonadaceae bacterium G21597-S1]|nr:hypothetical protein [Comamonadaceae bacterium G21597-S1]
METLTPGQWALIATVVAVPIAIVTAGRWRWHARTRALTARLASTREPARPARFDARELDGLPPVVQRYFRAALPDGARIVDTVSLVHAGRFDTGETAERWKPFTSHQRVVTRRPGFVWNGRIAMAPGVGVFVHDAYVAGEGLLHPALLGLVSLAELRGGGELARGELMRFLAEAAWYPTALLPSQGVSWEAIDDTSARATLADAGLSVALDFRFDAQGLIASVRAPARGRSVGGAMVMRPWEGRWSDYQLQQGMRVPMSGEVAWLLPPAEGGRKTYWRGTVTALHYTFAA